MFWIGQACDVSIAILAKPKFAMDQMLVLVHDIDAVSAKGTHAPQARLNDALG